MDLTTMDAEMLGEILEQLSYVEILDWCRLHPRFHGLCNDPTSGIGQLLERKEEEEVVARVWYQGNSIGGAILLKINFPQQYFEVSIQPQEATIYDLIHAINNGFEFHQVDVGNVVEAKSVGKNLVNLGDEYMNTMVPANIFSIALQAGLRMDDLGEEWEHGYVDISVGGETRFVSFL